MDMDAYRSGEDQRPPWMSDGETTTTTPSPSPAWPPSPPAEFHLGRMYSPPHMYYAPMMMGLDVAGEGNLQEYQSEPAISAAALSVRWSPEPPSPQPWSPTMEVQLWSFIDRPISSPEELGPPAPAEARLDGLLLICLKDKVFVLTLLQSSCNELECTLMIRSKELSELVCHVKDLLTVFLDTLDSYSPFELSFPKRLIMGCSSSAEVDNAADKCSSIPGRATTLLGIENPRQRQEEATASLSPLSSRKKIVKLTNVKSHHHVSNESGGNNNEVTELLGHTDVEADKPASGVSRKRIRSQGRKSRAWPHFPNVDRNADNRITKAQCTYCDTWLEADPVRDGTSRLLRHITDHHKLDLDASPETNKKRMTLAIKANNQSRDQTAANWGGIVPDKVPNEDSILDSQDSVGKISRLEGQLLDKINSVSQEGILVLDEEDDDATAERDEYVLQRRAAERNDVEYLDDNREVTAIAGSGPPRPTTASRNTQGREKKQLKRSARIEEMMEKFPQESARLAKQAEEESARLAKQAEEEYARLAREKEAAESNDFSIKRCISVLNTLEVTKEEKAKAYAVLSKSKENREVFICSYEKDVESTLIWLRNEMV